LATLVSDTSYNDLYYCENHFEKTKNHPLQTSSNNSIFFVLKKERNKHHIFELLVEVKSTTDWKTCKSCYREEA